MTGTYDPGDILETNVEIERPSLGPRGDIHFSQRLDRKGNPNFLLHWDSNTRPSLFYQAASAFFGASRYSPERVYCTRQEPGIGRVDIGLSPEIFNDPRRIQDVLPRIMLRFDWDDASEAVLSVQTPDCGLYAWKNAGERGSKIVVVGSVIDGARLMGFIQDTYHMSLEDQADELEKSIAALSGQSPSSTRLN